MDAVGEGDLSDRLTLQDIRHAMTDDHLAKVKLFTVYAELGRYHDIDQAESVHQIFNVLESEYGENAAELLKHMLYKVGVSKKEVDKFKPSATLSGVPQGFLDFATLIMDIINNMSDKDFRDLKYVIPASQLKETPSKIKTVVELFLRLNQSRVLSGRNSATWDDLAKWLSGIVREDLAEKVREYKRRKEDN